jgi:hypothetical protein
MEDAVGLEMDVEVKLLRIGSLSLLAQVVID